MPNRYKTFVETALTQFNILTDSPVIYSEFSHENMILHDHDQNEVGNDYLMGLYDEHRVACLEFLHALIHYLTIAQIPDSLLSKFNAIFCYTIRQYHQTRLLFDAYSVDILFLCANPEDYLIPLAN